MCLYSEQAPVDTGTHIPHVSNVTYEHPVLPASPILLCCCKVEDKAHAVNTVTSFEKGSQTESAGLGRSLMGWQQQIFLPGYGSPLIIFEKLSMASKALQRSDRQLVQQARQGRPWIASLTGFLFQPL